MSVDATSGGYYAENENCPISMCDTDPNYCISSLSGAQLFGVSMIIWIPIVIVIVCPYLAAGDPRPSRRNDLDLHSTFVLDNARASTVFRTPSATEIDPPMYLCGIGLCPLGCGVTGLMVIIFVMVMAFIVVFYGLLANDYPCSTGLGRCRTISCVCGNAYAQGYVFMFGCLVITAFVLVQRPSTTRSHTAHRYQPPRSCPPKQLHSTTNR